jgi:hypothetical protein
MIVNTFLFYSGSSTGQNLNFSHANIITFEKNDKVVLKAVSVLQE